MKSTKLLMVGSAIVLGAAGFALSFLPFEIAALFHEPVIEVTALSFQLLGAAYLGFAMTNWMSRESLFGGIYGRPLVVGNLLHFFAAAMALAKSAMAGSSTIVLALGIVWGVMALSFGVLLFRSPVTKPASEQ